MGPMASSTLYFLDELGQRLSAATGDVRDAVFLFQRLSVVTQRELYVLIRESIGVFDFEPDLQPFLRFVHMSMPPVLAESIKLSDC